MNPIDIWPIGMIGGHYVESYRLWLAELLKSPGIDGVLAVFPDELPAPHRPEPGSRLRRRQARMRETSSPSPRGPTWKSAAIDRFEAIPDLACFDRSSGPSRGSRICHQTHRLKNRHRPQPRSFAIDGDSAAACRQGEKEGLLVGQDALGLLACYGIPAAAGVRGESLAALRAAAKAMRPPFVLKLAGRGFLHKSKWGGIVTGIGNLGELKAAREKIVANVRAKDPGVAIDAFQIQEQLAGGDPPGAEARRRSSVMSWPAARAASTRRSSGT